MSTRLHSPLLLVGLAFAAACGASSATATPAGPGAGPDGSAPGDDDAGAVSNDAATEVPCGPIGTLDPTFANGGLLVSEDAKALTQESIAAISDGASGLFVGFSPVDHVIPDSTLSNMMSVVHLDGTGKLDAAFGNAGRADSTFPNVTNFIGLHRGETSGAIYLLGVGAEQDGPTAVSGETIVRITAAGAVDKTFGGDGHVQFSGPSGVQSNGHVNDLRERSDGSIVVLTDGGLMHLDAKGSVSNSTLSPIFFGDTDPLRLLGAAGDSVLVVGAWGPSLGVPATGPTIARFTSSFAVDATYGSAGQTRAAIGSGASSWPHAARSDGGVFLAGASRVMSVDANGAIVPSFGTNGSASVGSDPVIASLARADGSLVYVTYPAPEGPQIVVEALTASGAKDGSFGTAGDFAVAKSVTRASGTKVDARYVGPRALLPDGQRRAYLVSIYGDRDATVFESVYVARFCLE